MPYTLTMFRKASMKYIDNMRLSSVNTRYTPRKERELPVCTFYLFSWREITLVDDSPSQATRFIINSLWWLRVANRQLATETFSKNWKYYRLCFSCCTVWHPSHNLSACFFSFLMKSRVARSFAAFGLLHCWEFFPSNHFFLLRFITFLWLMKLSALALLFSRHAVFRSTSQIISTACARLLSVFHAGVSFA